MPRIKDMARQYVEEFKESNFETPEQEILMGKLDLT
jgi:hypothetical protein